MEEIIEKQRGYITNKELKIREMTNELNTQAKTHESEISLRLKFERRLNHLHALNRSVNTTACEQTKMVEEKEIENKQIYQEKEKALEQLETVRSQARVNEMKLVTAEEKIRIRLSQIDKNKKQIIELQNQLFQQKMSISQLNKQIDNLHKQIESKMIHIEEFKVEMDAQNDIKRSLKEDITRKDIQATNAELEIKMYQEKLKDLEIAYESLKNGFEDYKEMRYQQDQEYKEKLKYENHLKKDIERKQSTITKLNDEKFALEQTIVKLTSISGDQISKISKLEDVIHKIRQSESITKIRSDQLSHFHHHQLLAIDKMKDEFTQANLLISDLTTAKEHVEIELKAKNLEYTSLKIKSNDRILALEAEVFKSDRENNRLFQELEMLKTVSNNQKDKILEQSLTIDQQQNKINLLEVNNKTKETAISQLEMEMKLLKDDNSNLRKDLFDAQRTLSTA